MANTTVAVLRTGIMGSAMARNLKGAGMEVRAWNRSRERAEPLAEDCIVVAESAAEAARGADFLVTMLAEALDVDPASFLRVIEGGPLGPPYAQLKGKMMIERDFPTSFSAKLVRKDVGLVLDAASGGPRLELARSVAALLDGILERGRGEEDMAVVYEAAREP